MKKFKKMSKGMGLLVSLIVIGAVITGAVLISYYASIQAKTDATQVLEYSEDHSTWQDAEDLSKSINLTDFCGPDIVTYERWFRANSNLDSAINVRFTVNDTGTDDAEGITFALQWNNSGVWEDVYSWEGTDGYGNYNFNPGDDVHFRIYIEGDEYLAEGDYRFTIDVEAENKT